MADIDYEHAESFVRALNTLLVTLGKSEALIWLVGLVIVVVFVHFLVSQVLDYFKGSKQDKLMERCENTMLACIQALGECKGVLQIVANKP